ncbi:DNA/RNA-binding protein Alba-like [Dillenia turbinata]|uniref:DNA/RNA-binding protein Alba-like n=1 Tax=Dillenia turbinata TaxID=194707 RepID=A0AAN8ZKN7_9MAGN
MDRYTRVEKPRPESSINENEIRITAQGLIKNYIIYATSLLQEKRVKEIVLKAMGQAISKTVAIAEIIKKRVPRLHQDTAISSVSITDVWEPIEEGLVPLEMTRHVSMISITLSTRELNKNSPGYQAPAFVEQQRPQYQYRQQNQSRQPRVPSNAICMTMDGVVVEGEDVVGAGVAMETIKRMVGTQTGEEVVDEAEGEAGVIKDIKVLDMKGGEVEGEAIWAEVMDVGVDGQEAAPGVVETRQSSVMKGRENPVL